MDEIITWRVLISLVIILTGIFIFKKIIKDLKKLMQSESLEFSLLSIFTFMCFFTFFIIQKLSNKIFQGSLLDNDFNNLKHFIKMIYLEAVV